MIDPRTASIAFTPADLRNRVHPTVGQLLIRPTTEIAAALDPAPSPGDHLVDARPPQANSYTESMPIVPDGEADAAKAMLAAYARLTLLDGLDPVLVATAFRQLAGWPQALADGRIRGPQRMAVR